MSDQENTEVDPSRGSFGTRFGFLMAAAGSAVGLGNIWKFPYITGEYGGGAFVLVYLACIVIVGLPLMYAELIIGRRGGSDVFGALRNLTAKSGSPAGAAVSSVAGIMAVLSGLFILSFYSVVAGWAVHFLGVSVGAIPAAPGGAGPTFTALFESFEWSATWHTVFMIITVVVVSGGINGGIEKICSRLMPGLIGILLLMLVYVGVTGGLGDSLEFLFAPNFHKLSMEAVVEALGHAFFTLSLGMGAMVTYGSYLKSDRGIVRDGVTIALIDTGVALLAGTVIFAVVFAGGKEAGAGPGLVFVTLPDLFDSMPGGTVIAIAFFVLLIFAALSSAISLLEVVVSFLVDRFGVSRKAAAAGLGVAIWGLGLLSANSSLTFGIPGALSGFLGEGDKAMLDILDNLTTRVMLPLGGVLIAVTAGWLITKEDREAGFEHLERGPGYAKAWTFLIRFVAPVLVLFVLLVKAEFISLG
ncbi:MAG: sodium-dependent transporter [Nannocystaceae bacterium]|nr:sodium-dependent transporter [bacterium]